MRKTVYIFSGLGADERVFCHLDLSAFDARFIVWEQPLPKESIEAYALRLSAQITVENPLLLGLSFGGVMAQEVAKLISYERLVILASVKNRKEIPCYYRWGGALGLHHLLPDNWLQKANPIYELVFRYA